MKGFHLLLLTAGAFGQDAVRLPRAAVDVRVEPGFIFTIETGAQGSDQIGVRDENGRVLLAGVTPAPAEPASRRVEVADLTRWGQNQIAVSVLLKLRMDASVYGLVLLDLNHPHRPPQFRDTEGYKCESLAAGPEGSLWCAGHQVTRDGRAAREYYLLRRYDSELHVVGEAIPRRRFEDPVPHMRLMRGPNGAALFWEPTYRVMCEAGPGASATCRSDLPVRTQGRPLLSVAMTPAGSLLALLPDRGGAEMWSTPYALYGSVGEKAWIRLEGAPQVPRGVQIVGYGQRGLALWNRTARTLSYLSWPLKRVAANEEE